MTTPMEPDTSIFKHRWVSILVASRLLGLDYSVCLRRAKQNRYGMTRQSGDRKDGLEVSTRGLELASCRLLSRSQIEAAIAGQRIPLGGHDWDIPKRPPPIEVIGVEVRGTYHANDKELIADVE